ncbi:unnamed protein product [Toxocara canis]|uniref:Smg4_UPF3 domain-containing protein n=1 Tax=Toxocara canis TaxID=6265 RepID=A0A183UPG4_TOXCA|nr:unnamed protein product [Toxocara canis]
MSRTSSFDLEWLMEKSRKENADSEGCVGDCSMKNDTSSTTPENKEKVKRKAPIKIVLRRLPRGMTWEELQTQLDPLPETEFTQFVSAGPDHQRTGCPVIETGEDELPPHISVEFLTHRSAEVL